MTTKQFLEDIDTLYDAVPYTGCWIWKGFLMHGYGGLWLRRNV